MNINDFKDVYSNIYATPEFKKRVLEKAAAVDKSRREPRFFRAAGVVMTTAAAFAIIIGGGFLIRYLNAKAEPTIVVTAGEMPELTDVPASAAETTATGNADVFYTLVENNVPVPIDEMPELTVEFASDYSFMNAYDMLFDQSPSEKYDNLYEWVVGENISEENARRMLADMGLDEDEIEAIAMRNEALCEKMFTMNAYRFYPPDGITYLSAADLYNWEIRDFYTLYTYGISVEDMDDVVKRMYETAEESRCYCAMKRKALLYRSYVLSRETAVEIGSEHGWENRYFKERVTELYSPFDELFTAEQLEELNNLAGEPTVDTIFNYYMLIKRTGVSEEEARAKLEQCKAETTARIYSDYEIDLIVGNDSYLFAKHFLSPYAAMSYQNMAGGSLILTAEKLIKSGAYGWLIDCSDVNPSGFAEEIKEMLSDEESAEILEYFEQQLELYREICEITENELGAAVLPEDMQLLEESKPELTDDEREDLRQLSFTFYDAELTGETVYECGLNYLLCFDSADVTEAIDKLCERLNSDEMNWLTVKKNLYLYHCREDGFTLYNSEYIGAMLGSSAYSWRLYGETVYISPYYESAAEYLDRYHITNVKADEYEMQTLYGEVVGEHVITVEVQIGDITGEGYYNTTDNIRLCLYDLYGTLLSCSYSSNGMSGLDGYLIYVVPDERYFDVYEAPNGEILIVLHTFYPERYREEGEVFTIDEAAGELKRFDASAADSDFYDRYGYGMFDYGAEGFTLCSDSEPIYRNEKDGQLIFFDFGTMLMSPADDNLYSE